MSSHCLVSSLAGACAMSFKDPLYEHLLKSPAEFQGWTAPWFRQQDRREMCENVQSCKEGKMKVTRSTHVSEADDRSPNQAE